MARPLYQRFSEFVQLPAKTAGLLPMLLGFFYALYVHGRPDWPAMAVFFVSLLPFELFITGLNNYVDSKTDGSRLPLRRKAAKGLLIALILAALAAAIVLLALEGVVVLLAGGLCFFVGAAYSFGPFPLSRTPLGEALSGLFEGFFIPFLTVYINAPKDALVTLALQGARLEIGFQLDALIRLAVLCLPAMAGIANIMLANNICDMERDRENGRRTLPLVIGRRASIWLFGLLCAGGYLAVLAMALFRVLPPYVLAVLAGAVPAFRNVRVFARRQDKRETFPLSIVNFALVMLPLIAVTAVAAFV